MMGKGREKQTVVLTKPRHKGGHRAAWRTVGWTAISLALYAATASLVRRGTSAGFDALFRTWGIEAATAELAPGWARLLYAWHGSIVTIAVNLAVILIAELLRRRWPGEQKQTIVSLNKMALSWIAGTGMALIITALVLIPDSMRLDRPLSQPSLSWGTLALWGISALGTIAEESFGKCVVYDGVRQGLGSAWATVIACTLFFLNNGGAAGGVLCSINVTLLGLVGCAIYARFGLLEAAAFRWGWSFANVFLLGFGGAERSIYQLYGVSESWLTGGDAGFIHGAWATVLLSSGVAILYGRAVRNGLIRLRIRTDRMRQLHRG